jgi:tRNA U55 pseudouridine synthase TruB
LVYDLGSELGCGGYVVELRRVGVRDFSVSDACLLGELGKKVEQRLVSLEEMGREFPFLELSDEEFEGLRDGKVLLDKKLEQEGSIMAFYKGKLVGVVEEADGGIKYLKCLTNG